MTVINLGNGRYIAGQPKSSLTRDEIWCSSCGGTGLDYDSDNELEVCTGCCGSGTVTSPGLVSRRERLSRLWDLSSKRTLAAWKRCAGPADGELNALYREAERLSRREDAIWAAYEQAKRDAPGPA